MMIQVGEGGGRGGIIFAQGNEDCSQYSLFREQIKVSGGNIDAIGAVLLEVWIDIYLKGRLHEISLSSGCKSSLKSDYFKDTIRGNKMLGCDNGLCSFQNRKDGKEKM